MPPPADLVAGSGSHGDGRLRGHSGTLAQANVVELGWHRSPAPHYDGRPLWGPSGDTRTACGLVTLADDLDRVACRRPATAECVLELRTAGVGERHEGTRVLGRNVRAEADIACRGSEGGRPGQFDAGVGGLGSDGNGVEPADRAAARRVADGAAARPRRTLRTGGASRAGRALCSRWPRRSRWPAGPAGPAGPCAPPGVPGVP
jgi:hypothetical protein